jgi:hypothetical protein
MAKESCWQQLLGSEDLAWAAAGWNGLADKRRRRMLKDLERLCNASVIPKPPKSQR